MNDIIKKRITGVDYSWIEENDYSLRNLDDFNANIKIALRLRRCMKERGWNQKKLAEVLDVSPQYVNKILRNQEPSFSVKVALEYGKKLNYPLIKVCDDNDMTSNIFVVDPLTHEELLAPSEVWSLDKSVLNGFNYLCRELLGKVIKTEKHNNNLHFTYG